MRDYNSRYANICNIRSTIFAPRDISPRPRPRHYIDYIRRYYSAARYPRDSGFFFPFFHARFYAGARIARVE